jgi:hypothetical protein
VTDEELRAMVRDAIARQSRPSTGSGRAREPQPEEAFRRNAAFTLLPLPRGGDADGMCIIEPSVRCTHCGYCLSYGH